MLQVTARGCMVKSQTWVLGIDSVLSLLMCILSLYSPDVVLLYTSCMEDGFHMMLSFEKISYSVNDFSSICILLGFQFLLPSFVNIIKVLISRNVCSECLVMFWWHERCLFRFQLILMRGMKNRDYTDKWVKMDFLLVDGK